MNYLIDELLNGNAFTLKKEPEVSVVGIIEVYSAIMQGLAIIHHDMQLWSLFFILTISDICDKVYPKRKSSFPCRTVYCGACERGTMIA